MEDQVPANRLYVGNLPWSTDVDELRAIFSSCGAITHVDIPKGRQGRSRGYGIVEYSSAAEAQAAIAQLEGHTLGDRNLTVREDNAPTKTANSGGGSKSGGGRGSGNVMGETPAAEGCRCYIGNLAWETTAESLVGAFEDYPHFSSVGSVVNAEVAKQPGGRSKGWGLVDFESPAAAESAIATLHNSDLQGRSIIVRLERAGGATKGPGGGANAGRPEASSGLQIVVRNLPWTTTSEDLRQVFQQVGNVVKADAVCHADTGRSKGWGTVLFETREQAQAAIQGFNGVELESRPMQIKLDRYD
ncbi:uncharacterized protein MICPUCDRAFT_60999 [Micromonas pusilla CCMP1545]|uniref:RRM domain-containing protein n=1 Tax=Micromonas pusilla (strain CCMP1545) TaxID=564608 RepID=C1N073_MICPC|nr:uncharacterized protein MICPUCDRAFT_60999 [Micromonas pusilla CCMP1545]EEH54995.1 hypothetical protein MICPUCDRAFT_60999 [Micromonas pusilla CCMP1545]|eukprot:XP_003061345.1 hypothetical protein MICPUCDRAFT_60999 [Micromonas pusilla CCMP1545]